MSPVLRHIIGVSPVSTLINGLGRYNGGPESDLALVSVEYGKDTGCGSLGCLANLHSNFLSTDTTSLSLKQMTYLLSHS